MQVKMLNMYHTQMHAKVHTHFEYYLEDHHIAEIRIWRRYCFRFRCLAIRLFGEAKRIRVILIHW